MTTTYLYAFLILAVVTATPVPSSSTSSQTSIESDSSYPIESLSTLSIDQIKGTIPPREFPYDKDCTKLKTCNSTMLKTLMNHEYHFKSEEITTGIDVEVPDLLKHEILESDRENEQVLSRIPNNVPIDTGTRLIDDGENTEDKRPNKTYTSENDYSKGPGVPLVQGQLAAILAGVFVVTSVIAYVGLLSWRRFLEHRYGNREMLVSEDDFDNNPGDLRHFTI